MASCLARIFAHGRSRASARTRRRGVGRCRLGQGPYLKSSGMSEGKSFPTHAGASLVGGVSGGGKAAGSQKRQKPSNVAPPVLGDATCMKQQLVTSVSGDGSCPSLPACYRKATRTKLHPCDENAFRILSASSGSLSPVDAEKWAS